MEISSERGPSLPLRHGYTFAISGTISAATLPPFFVGLASGQTASIVEVVYELQAGTCTAEITQNGSAVTGLSALSVTNAKQTTAHVAALADGDAIGLVISSPSSASGLTVTIFVEDTP